MAAGSLTPTEHSITHIDGVSYYVYTNKKTLKNGTTVYYPKRMKRLLKRRPNLGKKNAILSEIKKKIAHDENFSVDEVKQFSDILAKDPEKFKKFLQTIDQV